MKYLSVLLLALCGFNSYAQHPYTLKFTTPKELEGYNAKLKIWDYYSNHQFQKTDSIAIGDSIFSFKGVLNKPAEKAIISIENHGIEKFYLQFVIDTGFNAIKIVEIDTDYYINKLKNTKFSTNSNLIDHKLDSVSYSFHSQKKDIHSVEYYNSILKILGSFPSSYYSLLQLRILAGRARRDKQILFNTFKQLDPGLRITKLGAETDSILQSQTDAINNSKAGKIVGTFRIKTDKNLIFDNKSLLGAPYVIAFSATWCVPCQLYQQKLLKIYHKYRSKGLKVVYFNLDNNVKRWKTEIAERHLDWINVSEQTKFTDSKIAKQFYATSIPLYIVVNKKGEIEYNGNEIQDLNYSKLEKAVEKVSTE